MTSPVLETLLPALGGLAAGILLGLAFFGGLALTLRRLPASGRPGLLMVGSLAGRTLLLAGGLLGLALLGPASLLAALVGTLIARTILVRRAAGAGRDRGLAV